MSIDMNTVMTIIMLIVFAALGMYNFLNPKLCYDIYESQRSKDLIYQGLIAGINAAMRTMNKEIPPKNSEFGCFMVKFIGMIHFLFSTTLLVLFLLQYLWLYIS